VKGINLKNKIITIILAVFLTAGCLLITVGEKTKKPVYAVNEIFTANTENGEEQFSAKFGGDILFSVEKVYISNSGANNPVAGGNKTFYQRTNADAGGEARYFLDYYANSAQLNKKYVVKDGAFVMLDNVYQGGNYVASGDSTKSEAIIVSLGQYVYSRASNTGTVLDKVETAQKYKEEDPDKCLNPITAKMTYLSVSGYRNGVKMNDLNARDVFSEEREGSAYHDFMYVIPQTPENEGYYTFEFVLNQYGTRYTETFSFYLLFKTSYTGEVSFKDSSDNPTNNKYFIQPTLGWAGDGEFLKTPTDNTDNSVRYFSGKSGITNANGQITTSYPSITFDYSKYRLSYTHLANGRTTEYEYKYVVNNTANGSIGVIEYTATSGTSVATTSKTLNYADENNKIVTIILTESGNYLFNFEYIYSGYNSVNNPEMNLNVAELDNLIIHGAELQYSRYNYQSAEMKYVQISTNKYDKVDFIFPNAVDNYNSDSPYDTDGKDIEDYKSGSLGFIYEVNAENTSRVGDVVITNSKDTLINANLKSNYTTAGNSINDYDYLVEKIGNASFKNPLNEIAETITYQTTNQGSLWFTMNDEYENSFYFTSEERLTGEDLSNDSIDNKIAITPETSFNKTGYYLVFLKIVPTGLLDDPDATPPVIHSYYQIFAFKYSTNTNNITVVEQVNDGTNGIVDGKIVGAGKYTNQNVKVTWAQPDVFERAVKAYYYTTKNVNESRSDILKKSATALNNGDVLGAEVANEDFLKFLIELKSEGESATYKIFTIDRQNIAGVKAYVVAKNMASNTAYYSYDVTVDGSVKSISNAITDSYATLDWHNKASGAHITTTYTYTPFVKTDAKGDLVKESYPDLWFATNYILGDTIGSFNIAKSESYSYVDFANVLYNQGIYVFTLTDEAGNYCTYLLIIDRTEAWFKVGVEGGSEEFKESGSYQLFNKSTNYNIGSHKVIKLSGVNAAVAVDDINYNLYNIILGNYDKIKYFNGGNKGNLIKLFQNHNGDEYLTVRNNLIDLRDTQNNSTIPRDKCSGTINLGNSNLGTTSLIKTLYVYAENNRYSSTFKDNTDSYSKITIEINTDTSRGMVFYSDNILTDDVVTYEPGSNNRLITGSDKGDAQGIQGAHATDKNYVAFRFNVGGGTDFEVSKVEYSHYALNLNNYNSDDYYYTSSNPKKTVYENGKLSNGAVQVGDVVYFAIGGKSTADDGLYVVTRTYAKSVAGDSTDETSLNYYFIVDRNKIIDPNKNIGNYIKINLLESETEFDAFSTINVSTGVLSAPEDGLNNETYGIYLSTTKLPATLSIPAYKYFDGSNGSDYFAGKLSFKLFFVDDENQLAAPYDRKSIKIFDTNMLKQGSTIVWEAQEPNANGYYTINIYDYITKVLDSTKNGIRSRLTTTTDPDDNTQKTWLHLPGSYVLCIYDNVEPKANVQLLGFKVLKGKNPTAEIKSSFVENSVTNKELAKSSSEENVTYEITTNAEFINFILPKYDDSVYNKAQIDNSYIVIKRFFEGDVEPQSYLDYQYGTDVTNDKVNFSDIIKSDADGNNIVSLDTLLKKDGNIIQENLSKELYYLVTIRFKLNNKSFSKDSFINCYSYYDNNGDLVYWYESTYKIIIDREAPTTNVNNIINGYNVSIDHDEDATTPNVTYSGVADEIVEDYNKQNGTESMFEHGAHPDATALYFTYQYAKYYQDSNVKNIYALYVKANTYFSIAGIEKVLCKPLDDSDLANTLLDLPVTDTTGYKTVVNLFNVYTYSNLIGMAGYSTDGYYEIVELDGAGNATQYVVYYDSANAGEYLKVSVKADLSTGYTGVPVSDLFAERALTIYGLQAGPANEQPTHFFKITLEGNSVNTTMLTSFGTDFSTISNSISNLFTDLNRGEYTLTLSLRNGDKKSVKIVLYSEQDRKELNAERLIDEANRRIKLDGANYLDAATGIPYFAITVVVKREFETRTYTTLNAGQSYTNENDEWLKWQVEDDVTFKITITDAFGKSYTTNYNTKTGFAGFYDWDFEGEHIEDVLTRTYYTYQSAQLTYDQTLAASFKIYGDNGVIAEGKYTDYGIRETGNVIEFVAPFNTTTNLGKKYSFTIQFFDEEGNEDEKFNLIIDTDIPQVTLIDSSTHDSHRMEVGVNLENTDLNTFRSNALIKGDVNLHWDYPNNDYFSYIYTLRTLSNGVWEQEVLTNNYKHLYTKGDYQLVISVWDLEQKIYLGNKVYAFNLAGDEDALYYVIGANGLMLTPNSTFKYEEVKDMSSYFDTYFGSDVPATYLPLYITKTETKVVDGALTTEEPNVFVNTGLVKDEPTIVEIDNDKYTYRMYKVETQTYSQYFGLLIIKETNSFVDKAFINESAKSNEIKGDSTTFAFAKTDEKYNVNILGKEYYCQDKLLKKNSLVLEVYYNDLIKPVKVVDGFVNNTNKHELNYEILGNGFYTFVIKDKAGNIQEFGGEYRISATILREVVVTVNDEVPVENAFYNEPVEMRIYANAKYVTGSISVTAELNGEPYELSSYSPCLFEDYGVYRVVVSADFNTSSESGTQPVKLTKVINFTIINEKEVRQSIDLTCLSSYKITNVTNASGDDVTNVFKELMNINAYNDAMLISYEKILTKSDELKLSYGKQLFTLTYVVEGQDYPTRQHTFSFSLNNEVPKIDCSLEAGETTTKGFSISFNAGILYDQIGEAKILINDEVVAVIDELSEYSVTSIDRTFKANGDGDYYIQLVSSSGNIWISYKATIKEPLNFWAIVIIVVAVAAVVGVTVTIIVLRNKMRIR